MARVEIANQTFTLAEYSHMDQETPRDHDICAIAPPADLYQLRNR